MVKWIDISQPLHNNLAHWPGDTAFHYDTPLTKDKTGSVNIGRLTTSTHVGTHVDAPFHYLNDGERIIDLELERFIGECLVIDLSHVKRINASALKEKMIPATERLLIKTSLSNQPERFPSDVTPITPDGAAYMASLGIKLIGVDTPSVDPLSSKDLPGHHALHKHNIYILENVMLDHVPEGKYDFIALPLPLKEADGSLVRAVIKPFKEDIYDSFI